MGGGNRRYNPKLNDMFYPLHSQDFVRTGFSEISYTLSARDYKDPKCVISRRKDSKMENNEEYVIRKLTPLECFRLMDFTDEDFNKAKNVGISDSQLYKQAGNSICVGVLHEIYKQLYVAMPYLFDDLKVASFFSGIGAFESALDRLYDDVNNGVDFIKQEEERKILTAKLQGDQ